MSLQPSANSPRRYVALAWALVLFPLWLPLAGPFLAALVGSLLPVDFEGYTFVGRALALTVAIVFLARGTQRANGFGHSLSSQAWIGYRRFLWPEPVESLGQLLIIQAEVASATT
jgi:hypothetical protein